MSRSTKGVAEDFNVRVDTLLLLESYLELAIRSVLRSSEQIAVRLLKGKEEKSIPTVISLISDPNPADPEEEFMPVIFICGWYKPEKGEKTDFWPVAEYLLEEPVKYRIFNDDGSGRAAERAISYILKQMQKNREYWEKRFKEEYGEGYFESFQKDVDGRAYTGFRLLSCGCHPDQLAIGFAHMYFSK